MKRGLEIALQAMQEKKALSSRPHGDLTSLAPHERLPEILVAPREKTPIPIYPREIAVKV